MPAPSSPYSVASATPSGAPNRPRRDTRWHPHRCQDAPSAPQCGSYHRGAPSARHGSPYGTLLFRSSLDLSLRCVGSSPAWRCTATALCSVRRVYTIVSYVRNEILDHTLREERREAGNTGRPDLMPMEGGPRRIVL